MRIDDIIPYERNARHNEKAVSVVAESIREFGLRGTIGLESRENPVIVWGHTRVAACKSLGWKEIPDERVEYCDDLTEEQVKAFRLADNRTGEVATWNKALLKSEIRALDKSGFDMSRFRFDFKGKRLPYGAERLKTDRAYNLDIVSRADCAGAGMPYLSPCDAKPDGVMGFNYAKSASDADKAGKACHFFIDDYQFERLWTSPRKYVDVLRGFDCVLTPDFSLYMDMPDAMQRWNRYRSQALGTFWQREGLQVVPTLSWAQPETYSFCFDGIPRRSTVAVSTVGVHGDEAAGRVWRGGMAEAMRRLEPSRVLLYGGDIGFDFGSAEVVRYKANTAFQNRGK